MINSIAPKSLNFFATCSQPLMVRPEKSCSALEYYTDEETLKYTRNNHIRKIQMQMTRRAMEIIEMKDGWVLDIGCGSGHSLTAVQQFVEENVTKNIIIGFDINANMLRLCDNEGISLICDDIGKGLPFLPGSFDYIISISCLQWLFYPIDKEKVETRIKSFFSSLYAVMKRDATACFQLYFEARWQVELLMRIVRRTGFIGGLIKDGEGKRQKYFLLIELVNKKRKIKYITDELLKKNKKRKKQMEIDSDSSEVITNNDRKQKKHLKTRKNKRKRT